MLIEEKLKAALNEVGVGLSEEAARIEVEGTGGLSLRMSVEQKLEAGRQLGRHGGTERIYLRLEDKRGQLLAGVMSHDYPQGAAANQMMRESILATLVDWLVEGSGGQMPLTLVLAQRESTARGRVEEMRDMIKRLPEAEQDLRDAQTGKGWVARLPDMEAEAPAI